MCSGLRPARNTSCPKSLQAIWSASGHHHTKVRNVTAGLFCLCPSLLCMLAFGQVAKLFEALSLSAADPLLRLISAAVEQH
jgi:hypothetical protein